MSRVLFICNSCEHLGVEYISAVLKKRNHAVDLYMVPVLPEDSYLNIRLIQKSFSYDKFKARLLEKIAKEPPDIIAFSAVTDFYRYALDIAGDIRRGTGIPIIFGGIHPTTVPEYVIQEPCVDIVCLGEGERAMLELMNRIGEYKKEKTLAVDNLWFKKDGAVTKNPIGTLVEDLDEFPFTDKALFYDRMPSLRRQYNLTTTRGCPYGCTYCCNNALRSIYKGKGKYLRKRSVGNVISELEACVTKHTEILFFRDEVFPYNKQWLKEFADVYPKKIGLPYKLFIHPKAGDRETVELLRESGCVYVSVGVQSGWEESRRKYLKRFDTNQEIAEAVGNFKRSGIKVNIDQIAGVPGEGEEEMSQTALFYNRIRPNVVTYFWMTLYPNTEIISIYRGLGLVSDAQVEKINRGELQSDFLGGTVEFNKDVFYQFRTFLCYLPILPKWLIALMIRFRIYRFLNIKSRFISSLLPRLVSAPFNADLKAWKVEIGDWLGRLSYYRKFMKNSSEFKVQSSEKNQK